MSKFKNPKFKKRVWGCSESFKGLGSRRNVSQAVVVDKNDIQCFTHPDAMRRDDFSVNTCLSGGTSNLVDLKGGAMQSDRHQKW